MTLVAWCVCACECVCVFVCLRTECGRNNRRRQGSLCVTVSALPGPFSPSPHSPQEHSCCGSSSCQRRAEMAAATNTSSNSVCQYGLAVDKGCCLFASPPLHCTSFLLCLFCCNCTCPLSVVVSKMLLDGWAIAISRAVLTFIMLRV